MERKAAILYPGEMGRAVAKALAGDGWTIVSHLSGPSLACRDESEAAGVTDLPSLEEAFAASDLVISLVPPTAAATVADTAAEAAQRSGRRPLYLDANSVAPETVQDVARRLARAGVPCVDGAFIGSAADIGRRTRLFLSGPAAAELAEVLPGVLEASVLGERIGAASALKLAFSGFNKGLVALFLGVMEAGEAAGDRERLLTCLRDFYPGTAQTLERLLPGYPRHAARRADELGELERWLVSEGRDAEWVTAARDVLRRVAALDLDPTRSWTPAEIAAAWAAPSDTSSDAGGTGSDR